MLTNALRHGVSPVTLGVTRDGQTGQIWVSDAGPGPSDEVLARMTGSFERFAVSQGQSAGLGLSIVNAVAAAFDGSVQMGRVDGAFRVTIALPAVEAPDDA
jgi:two-component system sensor histidine kinase TctE